MSALGLISKGSVNFTTKVLNGKGRMKPSQLFSFLTLFAYQLAPMTFEPVRWAARKRPSCMEYFGPLGPSGVTATGLSCSSAEMIRLQNNVVCVRMGLF